jgi:hypothetical protein
VQGNLVLNLFTVISVQQAMLLQTFYVAAVKVAVLEADQVAS